MKRNAWLWLSFVNALAAGVNASVGSYGLTVFNGVLVIMCCTQGVINAIRDK